MSTQLDQRLSRVAALRPAANHARAPATESILGRDLLAELLGAEVAKNRYGEHLAVRRWYSTPVCFLHGDGNADARTAHALRMLLAGRPGERNPGASAVTDPEQWLFLDTETTGLAGGTGTYAFLVGLAWWDTGGLQVEQLFMRDYDEEHSLLLELSRRMAQRRVMVTFNGKSFDWPLLENRFRMTRALEAGQPVAHLDLLHPARQLWRPRLGSVRLCELERQVLDPLRLGWTRQDDIDSALIPQIYFDYLRGGRAEPLAAVFRHNQMDLRGLAALAGKIVAMLAPSATGPDGDGMRPETVQADPLDLYGLSRLLWRRGDAKGAQGVYEHALAAGLPRPVDRAARRELARLAKRHRDFERATSLWQELAALGTGDLEAYEQLAIHYEHRLRQPRRAAELTRAALASLREARRLGSPEADRYHRVQARLKHRLARLERKSGGARPEPELAASGKPVRKSNRGGGKSGRTGSIASIPV